MQAQPRADRVEYACSNCGTLNRIPRARLYDDPTCGACKRRVFPHAAVTGSDATFTREVLESPLPTLVDFWAAWCGPCRVVAPILEELARERGGRLKVVVLNVDENPQVAGRYGISAIPNLKLFKEGRVVEEVAGAVPKAQLLARIGPHLPARS